ncbi:MAG TPA: hypothetical protein VFY54_00180 [Rubrobacter sp.]|nr:hypothetical protein [Rubrobacter sp.]
MKEDQEWWREEADALTIGWAGYAEYRVGLHPSPFAEAIIGPIPDSEAAVAFLLSVLPMCLPLFDVEPLHASAVRTGGGALLCLGPRGAGKSSIAAAMESLGFSLLADDCSAIDDQLRLWPGPPLLNPRWTDAEQPIVGTYNTKDIRSPLRYSSDPHAVAGILSLAPSESAELEVKPLQANDAFVEILGNVRSPDVFAARRRTLQFRVASALSTRPAATLTFDPARHDFTELAETVAGWAQ